ncbi:dihydrofolate reductase family protein [Arthrobacter castelli]|uniref:dihydrofolate reductase family protein n=1 Tax=Arthrobacter castelli TaxID=271431 RepID=UPI00040E5A61|nr:dihydrofolate reductase family protein [Arthrobacter castelli]
MPKVIFNTATSLNGFIADTDNSLGWLFAVEDPPEEQIDQFMNNVGVLVEGSTTYEWVLEQERLMEHPEKWQESFGTKPTYVFTSRQLPTPDGADVRFVDGDPADFFDDIAQAAGGKNIWVVGGGDLVGQFFDVGLLDEVQTSIAPVTLDGGAPLLPRLIGSDALKLRSVEKMGQFAHLIFDVRRPGAPD